MAFLENLISLTDINVEPFFDIQDPLAQLISVLYELTAVAVLL